MKNFKTLTALIAAASVASMGAMAADTLLEGAASQPYDGKTSVNHVASFDLNSEHDKVLTMEKVVVDLQTQLQRLEAELNQCLIAKNQHFAGNNTVVYTGGGADQSCKFSSTVCSFYSQITGGLPENSGGQYWEAEASKLRASGMDDAQVMSALRSKAALLPEAVAHAGTGGVNSGRGSVDYNGNQSSYSAPGAAGYNTGNQLDSLYQNVMGRAADDSGKAWFEQQINSGNMTINDVYNHMSACTAAGTCF